MKVKYLVEFQNVRRVGSERRTKVQFYQFYAESALEAKESAELTRQHLSDKTGAEWVIGGVFVQCDL